MITKREKTIAGILVFFACVTLVLGIAQFYKVLRAPLLFTETKPDAEAQNTASESIFSVDPNKDTDGDGLPDADELTRYGTSPYLADSDSDGKTDREEIEKGTDPNCPEGRACGIVMRPPSSAGTGQKTISDLLAREGAQALQQSPAGQSPTPRQPDARMLRDALRAQGVPDAQLQAIDDATLLRLYAETERDSAAGGAETTATATTTGATQGAQAPSPAALRRLLQEQGVSAEQLSALDDATLLQLYREGIQKK